MENFHFWMVQAREPPGTKAHTYGVGVSSCHHARHRRAGARRAPWHHDGAACAAARTRTGGAMLRNQPGGALGGG